MTGTQNRYAVIEKVITYACTNLTLNLLSRDYTNDLNIPLEK